jgi:hypothetical protein
MIAPYTNLQLVYATQHLVTGERTVTIKERKQHRNVTTASFCRLATVIQKCNKRTGRDGEHFVIAVSA